MGHRNGIAVLALASTLSLGCSACGRTPDSADPPEGANLVSTGDPDNAANAPAADRSESGSPGPGGGGAALPSTVAPAGSVDVNLTADRGAADDAVVSVGVPFPQGVLKDGSKLALKNASGAPVAITTKVLAKWPADGSIRSVLVAFKAKLASGAKQTWALAYGGAPGPTTAGLGSNPDGPIAALLPADWYAKSHVSGVILPVAANKRFASYDSQLASAFAKIDFSQQGVNCPSTTNHRTYYDGPHARYQRFLRTGDPADYRNARSETIWYRQNEVRWSDGRTMAVEICQPSSWTPQVALQWDVLRRMASQGNLDDYLVTGDPAAREVVVAFGEAYRRNLPALTAGSTPPIEATERNLAWTMMGLASYYALDSRKEVFDALASLVDRAIAWQKRGTSGAFEHDIRRPDPEECGNGPKGASPFMTSLLVDGLMDYWLLTGDTARVEPVVRKLAVWYETKAITSNKQALRYLWNCLDDPYDDTSAELNILIGHVFGAAYVLTKDTHWLDFGDTMADSGMSDFYAGRPKQWNQSARSFGKYLGYRALGKTP